MKTKLLPLFLFSVLVGVLSSLIFLNTAPAEQNKDVAEQFRLIPGDGKFSLEVTSAKGTARIPVERKWLIPPGEEKEDAENYVSAFHYDQTVDSFAVGDGKIGLHLSSYTIQKRGSAAAAAGKDVFLVCNPGTAHLADGLTSLGITKVRLRSDCFRAENSIFILSDVNGDRLTDIGVIQESISCDAQPQGAGLEYTRSNYAQKPVRWYLYSQNKWAYNPAYDGKWAAGYRELALIGMATGPVDFVANELWGSYDPSRWKTRDGKPPVYTPAYRKTLMDKGIQPRQPSVKQE